MQLEDIDFKHLRLLEAIIRKRSISDAARMLDIPQPTASHGLGRLRRAFGDDLLVRVSGGMEPTPRAVFIAKNIEKILRLKREMVDGGDDFSLETLEREFVLACSDIGQLLVVGSVFPYIAKDAPRARIKTVTLSKRDMVNALEAGEVDLALGAYPHLISGIHTRLLYKEDYACFAAADHPFVQSGLYEDFLASEHIIVSTGGMAHAHRDAERQLVDTLPKENVHIVTSSFFAALVAVQKSKLILTAPRQVISEAAARLGVALTDPPLSFSGFDVRQYWHSREHNDPAHKWLRQTVAKSMGMFRGAER